MEDVVDGVPICTVKASSIKQIDKKSVHRICSGQVVLTLATAVKELVENSIDAGATSVEVKLKDYGSESIEVIDNGSGVEEINFEGLTLKHHTSKLTDFDDLINVSTFGFRGEALSSLCALSNMAIITRHKSSNVGTRLEFDQNGKILTKKIIPKPVGTIVVIQNIFHSLPVRHKEFHKNLKKEFARLIQVLNAYCIINTEVKISCVNLTTKGNRSTVISTNCNASIRDNISNVFGSKQLQSLLEFKQIGPKDDICSEYGIKAPKDSIHFNIGGFISKCEHGQGRSSSDRQFIFINKRPCDASKILKLINEVYHMYNRHQNPFVALSIEMQKESVDVNVTPDKRQVFLDGEKLLLAVLKTSLIDLFEPTSSVYKVNNISSCSMLHRSSSNADGKTPPLLSTLSSPIPQHSNEKLSLSDSLSKLKRSFSSAFDKNRECVSTPDINSNHKSKTFTPSIYTKKFCDESVSSTGPIKQFFTPLRKKSTVSPNNNDNKNVPSLLHHRSSLDSVDKSDNITDDIDNDTKVMQTNDHIIFHVSTPRVESNGVEDDKHSLEFESMESISVTSTEQECHVENSEIKKEEMISETIEEKDQSGANRLQMDEDKADSPMSKIQNQCNYEMMSETENNKEEEDNFLSSESFENGPDLKVKKKEVVVNFSLDRLRRRLKRQSDNLQSSSSFSRTFRAKISPGDNKSAEEELQREISKDMFSKMEILGQFNLGFIITKLGSDLFIVDQHATDEKYNFEMLQRNHVLQSQKMIIPQNLELTSSNETILMDSLDVFKKNGFDFLIEPEALPTQRVKLVSAPVSKNWSFGKDDIEELLFMLMDSPNVMCRPTRVRMMFASRACRKSIMIGTALNHNEMKRLLTHMGEIEQPWNCPHGRPTMRHLFNLNMLPT